ncbi:hypothetical protein Q4E93_25480 [Flavitalea sp. BT771]|uniref:hypothetical protein n=1 Tax=Flavitalea sp. BT771 TaxID=3063329 RepID=UPI0026E2D78F|nr:hypothetical protein [Flavitalea sp. BT771]MDO6433985.1 hypothetical protein [Flavitalea sp. BT771]MDV6222885.1 hypothetical protein [Flavitalea sp. BT771]
MKYFFLYLVLMGAGNCIYAQSTYSISSDSVKLTGPNSSELIIENHTKNVVGLLFNTGNGRTVFKKSVTKLSDSLYLIGADTLKILNQNAWIQGGNTFGTTGVLGTKDNNHLDLYTNNTRKARLDSLGNLLIGTTTSGSYKLDVNGPARFSGYADVNSGDVYSIRLIANYGNGWAAGVDASMVSFGGACVGTNKQALGNIPVGSFILGRASPGNVTAVVDYYNNPVFVVNGNGVATINGGYGGIGLGGTTGNPNGNAPNFAINGGRGTGTGVTGDIIFSTGTAQASGSTIHAMTNRWWMKGQTGYLSNSSSPTSAMDVTGASGYSQLRLRTTYTPSSSSDANGNTGDFSWDSNYIYVKTASGWKRAALTTF